MNIDKLSKYIHTKLSMYYNISKYHVSISKTKNIIYDELQIFYTNIKVMCSNNKFINEMLIISKKIYYSLTIDNGRTGSNKVINHIMNKIVNIILEKNPQITIEGYELGCMIGNYKLIEKSFENHISPDYNYIGLLNTDNLESVLCNGFAFVISSNITENEMIRIYDLFIKNGFNNQILNNQKIIHCIIELFYVNLLNHIINSGCDIQKETLNVLCNINRLVYIQYRKQKNKDKIKKVIDIIISKTLYQYTSIETEYILINLCKYYIESYYQYIKYHGKNKYKYIFFNNETAIEYFIKQLLINGVHIDIKNIIDYVSKDDPVFLQLIKIINNYVIPRRIAINFVKDISNYLLPDISNVVFDHCYNFNYNIHYILAVEV
jgi:hypothetical protein